MVLGEDRPPVPLDFMVIGFPVGVHNFPGMLAAELASLIENGVITVVDLLILETDRDGEVHVQEMEDLDAVRELEHVRMATTDVVPRDDIGYLVANMESGMSAGVLVWENTWAIPLGVGLRRAGCRIISGSRIS